MKRLVSQRGGSRLVTLIVILVLVVGVHVGIKLVPMYMDAERMKDAMSVKARFAQELKDDEILTDLANKAQELNLPLGRDSFTLQRDDDSRRMKISTSWDVDVDLLWGYYSRTYHFAPVIEEDYARHF